MFKNDARDRIKMKKYIPYILIMCLISPNLALAKCDWAKDIKRQGNTFLYPAKCHHAVGVMKKDLKDREEQVVQLKKTIKLKDLAMIKSDERIVLWRDQSYNQFERLQKQARLNSYNKWLHFGGGVVLTVLSVWAAGQISR